MGKKILWTQRVTPHLILRYKQLDETARKRIRDYMEEQLEKALNVEEMGKNPQTTDNSYEKFAIESRQSLINEFIEKENQIHKMILSQASIFQSTNNNPSKIGGYVYIVTTPSQEKEHVYKIGVSKDVDSRIKQLNTATHETFKKILAIRSSKPYDLESELHDRFKENKLQGEFFRLEDYDLVDIISMYGAKYYGAKLLVEGNRW